VEKRKDPTQKNNPKSGPDPKRAADASHRRADAMARYFWETRSEKWLAGNGRIGYKISSGPNSLCSGHEGRKARRKRQGGRMKKAYLLVAAMLLAGIPAPAKEPQAGTIVSESSVACGSQVTKNKKGTMEVLCQEYVVRTETTEYHVRQEKAAKQEMIPVNTSIEFTLDKDKMKFKANGKKYEYIVVSESAVTAAKP